MSPHATQELDICGCAGTTVDARNKLVEVTPQPDSHSFRTFGVRFSGADTGSAATRRCNSRKCTATQWMGKLVLGIC